MSSKHILYDPYRSDIIPFSALPVQLLFGNIYVMHIACSKEYIGAKNINQKYERFSLATPHFQRHSTKKKGQSIQEKEMERQYMCIVQVVQDY